MPRRSVPRVKLSTVADLVFALKGQALQRERLVIELGVEPTLEMRMTRWEGIQRPGAHCPKQDLTPVIDEVAQGVGRKVVELNAKRCL